MPKSATAPEKSTKKTTKKIDLELLKESQLVELALRVGSPLSKSNIRANRIPKIIEHINDLVKENGNQDLLETLYAEMKATVAKIDDQIKRDQETKDKATKPTTNTVQQVAAQSARDARAAEKEINLAFKKVARDARRKEGAKKQAKADKEKKERASSAKSNVNAKELIGAVLGQAIEAKRQLQGYPTYIGAMNTCINKLEQVIK